MNEAESLPAVNLVSAFFRREMLFHTGAQISSTVLVICASVDINEAP